MFIKTFKALVLTFNLMFLLFFAGTAAIVAQTKIPRPTLVFKEKKAVVSNGQERFLYRLDVENKADFPEELFAPAPDLPPCGKNANSSRSWVNIYSQRGGYIYGFCGLKSPAELNQLAFILPTDTNIDNVYIVIVDRKMNKEYKSTLVSIRGK